MDSATKTLALIGLFFLIAALVWYLTDGKIPLGRLPGDIRIEGENSKIFIPITSSLIISFLLSVLFYLFRR